MLRAAQQAYVAAGQGDEFWISKAAAIVARRCSAQLDASRAQRVVCRKRNRASTTPPARSRISSRSIAARATTSHRPAPARLGPDLRRRSREHRAMLASLEPGAQRRSAGYADMRRSRNSAHRGARARAPQRLSRLAVVVLLVTGATVGNESAAEAVTAYFHGRCRRRRWISGCGPVTARRRQHDRRRERTRRRRRIDLRHGRVLCSGSGARRRHARAAGASRARRRACSMLRDRAVDCRPDGRELSPIVTHGYSQQMVLAARHHPARRPKMSPRRLPHVAAPNGRCRCRVERRDRGAARDAGRMCRGSWPPKCGDAGEKDPAKLAAATIVAAQLATLVGPPSTRAQARADAVVA